MLLIALVGGLRVPGLPWWGLALGLVLVAAMAWRLGACPHAGPLALLPATTGFDGTRLPPRWSCDACGRTWAAHFDKEQTPIRKFTGYDESKAVNAAKRAAELTERRRALALQRAGLRPAQGARTKVKPVPAPALAADHADVVPIDQGRRFAG